MNKILICKHDIEPICGKLCNYDHITNLMTRLAIIEGSVLEVLEKQGSVTLRELIEELEWEPCAVAMAVGSLIRQGVVKSTEVEQNVFIEIVEAE